MFIIFGAQEEVFEVWMSWYHSLLKNPFRSSTPVFPSMLHEQSYLDFDRPASRSRWNVFKRSETVGSGGVIVDVKHESFSDHSADSFAPDISIKASDMQETYLGYPIRIPPVSITPPTPTAQSPTVYLTHNRNTSTVPSASLRPPPRPPRSRSESPVDGASIRHPFAQMPSLTAFGNRDSTDDVRIFTRSSRRLAPDGDLESSGEDTTSRSKSQSPDTGSRRPDTGQTCDTFGEHA